MQYGFRVVFYLVARGNPESAMAAAFNKASKDISKGRTAFRLFRWLDEYYKFVAWMLTQGGQGGRPAPLALRFHRIRTHFLLNLYGI